METFAIRNLSFAYPNGQPALADVSLTVGRGEFLLLCGESGSGKSTLLRLLKPSLSPHGERSGEIVFEGESIETLDPRRDCAAIGFVQQDPDAQIVTDKVWHELAFGLESLGFDTPTIRRRVAEMAAFFGMESWFERDVASLSGGQKQLLNLASVLVLQPSVLILDEPTSRLDPIAASEFLAVLSRVNRELGTTVILSEHRLEEALPMADSVAVLERGRLLAFGAPRAVGECLRGDKMFLAMPASMRVWASTADDSPCPLTVREGREWLSAFAASHPLHALPSERKAPEGDCVLRAENLHFRYEKDLPDTVKKLSLSLHRGEFLALLGGNGAGKTTTLHLLAGLLTPQRGEIFRGGRIGLMPQDVRTLFTKKTVREELAALGGEMESAVRLCRLEELLERHPYDLSGGEQQRLALAMLLLRVPDILLLDEPTQGLDAAFKDSLGEILSELLRRGVSILAVSHDAEFCARFAHTCALFFGGSIAAMDTPRRFFSLGSFYTTAAERISRPIGLGAVTTEELIAVCGGTEKKREEERQEVSIPLAAEKKPPLPMWRKAIALVGAAASLALLIRILRVGELSSLLSDGFGAAAWGELRLSLALIFALFVTAFALSRKEREVQKRHRSITLRGIFAAALWLTLVGATLLLGASDNRNYRALAVVVLLECMAPFFLRFEHRKPRAREVVLLSALCALGVAGRAAFFMLPQFKPVMALVILAGAVFGCETGFLTGAVTMLVSNVLFSQGPWTPWQMFAMGLVGFAAGLVFHTLALLRSRSSLCLFGAIAAIVLYGLPMNFAASLIYTGGVQALPAYLLAGLPMDCVQALSTVLFLWVGAEAMLEKLLRVKKKYGLLE